MGFTKKRLWLCSNRTAWVSLPDVYLEQQEDYSRDLRLAESSHKPLLDFLAKMYRSEVKALPDGTEGDKTTTDGMEVAFSHLEGLEAC
jgi:hypothetical protein